MSKEGEMSCEYIPIAIVYFVMQASLLILKFSGIVSWSWLIIFIPTVFLLIIFILFFALVGLWFIKEMNEWHR